MNKHRFYNLVGWIGTCLILLGYGCYTLGIFSDVMIFHYCNFLGSLGVMAISAYKKVWQPALINACMAIFALIAIIRFLT